MNFYELAEKAIEAKKKAIPTYSNFHVGAALKTKDGKIYTGSNIENSSYSLTICAERTAIFTALHDGAREFDSIAIAGDAENLTPPCGACRQVLMEHCGPELNVVLVNPQKKYKVFKLKDLLPLSFTNDHLK